MIYVNISSQKPPRIRFTWSNSPFWEKQKETSQQLKLFVCFLPENKKASMSSPQPCLSWEPHNQPSLWTGRHQWRQLQMAHPGWRKLEANCWSSRIGIPEEHGRHIVLSHCCLSNVGQSPLGKQYGLPPCPSSCHIRYHSGVGTSRPHKLTASCLVGLSER